MTKLHLAATAAALLTASVAQAAHVAYTLQIDDGAPGNWTLYGDVTYGSAGLCNLMFSLRSDLLVTKKFLAPKVTFYKNNDPEAEVFTAGLAFSNITWTQNGLWSAAANLDFDGAAATPPTSAIVYGFGQTGGNLLDFRPPGYDSITSATQTTYDGHLKLASGTYNTALPHTTVADWFDRQNGSYSSQFLTQPGSVTKTGTRPNLIVSGPGVDPVNTDSLPLDYYTSMPGYVDGTIVVTDLGSGRLASSVVTLDGGAGYTWGYMGLLRPNSPYSPHWIAAKIISPDAAQALAGMPNQASPEEYAALLPEGYNALFKFGDNSFIPRNISVFNWDLSGWDARISELTSIPEPASLSLLTLGITALLLPRRRTQS